MDTTKPLTNNDRIIQRLTNLGIGTHYCGWLKGYITIEKGGFIDVPYIVMWTSGKDKHDPLSGNSISVDFKYNGYDCIFESAITNHLVIKEEEKQRCINFIEDKIDCAYNNKNQPTNKQTMKKLLVLPTWILVRLIIPILPEKHAWKNQKFTLTDWAKNSTGLNNSISIWFWFFLIDLAILLILLFK